MVADFPSELNETELHPKLATLVALGEGLAATFGPRSEVVIHDLSRLPNSIVAIYGELTGRKIGGPATDFLLGRVQAGQFVDQVNYVSITEDGRTFRSSTLFIRGDGGEVVGCLCVNLDVTEWRHLSAFAEWQLSGTYARAADLPAILSPNGEGGEHYPVDVEGLRKELIARAISEIGVPVDMLHKKHKLAIVERLEREGYFMLRDAVTQLASALSVTRHSVYNYLNAVREKAADEPAESSSEMA
jgi:predicted transcriptional regulator YheO